jgi:hypothetical protein
MLGHGRCEPLRTVHRRRVWCGCPQAEIGRSAGCGFSLAAFAICRDAATASAHEAAARQPQHPPRARATGAPRLPLVRRPADCRPADCRPVDCRAAGAGECRADGLAADHRLAACRQPRYPATDCHEPHHRATASHQSRPPRPPGCAGCRWPHARRPGCPPEPDCPPRPRSQQQPAQPRPDRATHPGRASPHPPKSSYPPSCPAPSRRASCPPRAASLMPRPEPPSLHAPLRPEPGRPVTAPGPATQRTTRAVWSRRLRLA